MQVWFCFKNANNHLEVYTWKNCLASSELVYQATVVRGRTYLCLTVVTVSDATLVVMFFAATSKPVHMVANPGPTHKTETI